MTPVELLAMDFDLEIVNTRRMLERVPEEQALAGWTPHPKSMPMGKLAMHIATLPTLASYIFQQPSFDKQANPDTQPDETFISREHLLMRLAECAAGARAALRAIDENTLGDEWRLSMGERLISNHSRALTYRLYILNHLIHHRAQLGVYLRLLDIPVPGSYGPSADEQSSAHR